MFKRFIICLAFGTVIGSLLGGCASVDERDVLLYDSAKEDTGEAEEKVSLTFFGYKADAINLKATEAAMQSFMAECGNVDITYEGIKGTKYEEVFGKRVAADMMDDICMVHHDDVVRLEPEGKLADLSDLPGIENYTDEAKSQFTNDDGTVYFLPTSNSTYNLYINYDILEAHDQKVPENWDEFQKCCDYFVSQGIVPIIANNRNSLPTLIISRGLFDFYQRPDVDAEIEKVNEDPSLMAEALKPGVAMAAEIISRGWIDTKETLNTAQTSDDLAIFLKGERPFMITGGWASIRVSAENPSFTYGVYPYPILDDGSVMAIQMDTCVSVNANSEHLKEAKEFVSYLIRPDVMWVYCDSQASYSPLKEGNMEFSEQPLNPSVPYLTNGRVVFRSDYRLSLPTEAALGECAKVLLGGGGTDEANAALLETLKQ